MNIYTIGAAITLSVTFRNSTTLLLGDPTTVLLRTEDPTRVETDYTVSLGNVSHPSTGIFQAIIYPRVPGIWWYRWEGGGGIIASSEGQFEARPSLFRVLNLVHISDTGRYVVTGVPATLMRG